MGEAVHYYIHFSKEGKEGGADGGGGKRREETDYVSRIIILKIS